MWHFFCAGSMYKYHHTLTSGIGSLAASSYPLFYEFCILFHEMGVRRVHFRHVIDDGLLNDSNITITFEPGCYH